MQVSKEELSDESESKDSSLSSDDESVDEESSDDEYHVPSFLNKYSKINNFIEFINYRE